MALTSVLGALGPAWRGLLHLLIGGEPRPVRRRRLWPQLVALLLTMLLALALLGEVRIDFRPPPPIAPLLSLLVALPVALLVRWPLWAWRLTVATSLAMMPFYQGPPGLPWHPVQVLLYLATVAAVGLRHPRAVLVWIWALTMALVWTLAYRPEDNGNAIGSTVILTLLTIAVGGVGALLQARRQLAVETQRTEAEQFRRAQLEERARIARELHDVVAHHMSLIVVAAQTAPYRLPGLDRDAREELDTIGGTAREALVEMRRLLGILRSEPPGGEPERAPQPGLRVIDELVGSARHTGTDVTQRTLGRPRPVPAGVDVSAYRLVQEALSNARRHAPGAPVLIRVEYDPDALRVTVTNGPARAGATASGQPGASVPGESGAAAPGGPGHGVVGMRERVGMLGGALEVGPTAEGGFRVLAVLPCPADAIDAAAGGADLDEGDQA